MDNLHHEFLALAQAFVAQATPIIREQERLIEHLHEFPQDSRLMRCMLATVATASDALAEQEVLIEQLDQIGDSARTGLAG